MSNHKILFCACSNADIIPQERRQAVAAALENAAADVTIVADLCGLAARCDVRLRNFALAEKCTIIACYPRAVKALFAACGFPLAEHNVRMLNMREMPAADIVAALELQKAAAAAAKPDIAWTETWRPWFPVIDGERCSNCGQCLNFCLFGVYTRDGSGQVSVSNPANCKNNCPSCARICPETAIMFPKIDEDSLINGSCRAASETPDKVRLKVDDLYGGNLAEKLQRRRRERLLKRDAFQQTGTTDASETDSAHAARD